MCVCVFECLDKKWTGSRKKHVKDFSGEELMIPLFKDNTSLTGQSESQMAGRLTAETGGDTSTGRLWLSRDHTHTHTCTHTSSNKYSTHPCSNLVERSSNLYLSSFKHTLGRLWACSQMSWGRCVVRVTVCTCKEAYPIRLLSADKQQVHMFDHKSHFSSNWTHHWRLQVDFSVLEFHLQ